MVEIPLERIERGLRWLLSRDDVVAENGRAAVVGASRGGELALLLAATFPSLVGPVVAYTPSGVVWVGLDFTQPAREARSTWSYRGQPFPYLPFPPNAAPAHSERGLSMLPLFEAALDDRDAAERAAIATERAHGPLLLVSGGDDRVWAAGRMCRMIVDRMSRHGRAKDVKHLHYPEAGHMLFPYIRPSDAMFPAYSHGSRRHRRRELARAPGCLAAGGRAHARKLAGVGGLRPARIRRSPWHIGLRSGCARRGPCSGRRSRARQCLGDS